MKKILYILVLFCFGLNAQVYVNGSMASLNIDGGMLPDNAIRVTAPVPALPNLVLDNLYAFPGALGAGKELTGGRGGSYYAVTNLNDSGPGSYREARSQGNRIVIPKVEGRVNLASAISGTAPDNVTVWGQFAPGARSNYIR